MTSKFLLKSLIVILFLTLSSLVKAQENIDFINQQLFFFNASQNNHTYFYYGNINLKNNEILEGRISLNDYHDGQYSAILKTDDGCRYIPNHEIEDVVLFSSNDDLNEDTRFTPIKGKKRLYRELYAKNSDNAIYDSMEKPFDGKTMSGIYVLENNNLLSIYNFWHSGPKADLLNYFEDRDQKKYKRRDYKNLEKLFAQL